MENCIFCKIANKEIPTELVYESNDIIAFNDIHPQAPVHILIIPKKHIASIADLSDGDRNLAGDLILAANIIAKEQELTSFRLVSNTGTEAGQSVPHLHFHLLGGKKLGPIA